MKEWLAELGINVPNAIGGFSGGFVNIFLARGVQAFEALGYVFVGMVTAGYLASVIGNYVPVPEGAIGFLVGLGALQLCQRVIKLAKIWKPTFGVKPDA